jgi:hypothetical protein
MSYGKELPLEERARLRRELEIDVFRRLREKYQAPLDAFWATASFPAKSTHTVLFIERRIHPNTDFVLKNMMYFCPGFSITIVCSKENEPQIRSILGPRHEATTHFIIPFDTNSKDLTTGYAEYNNLLTSVEFWKQIPAEVALTSQIDNYLMRRLPAILEELDYCAAYWSWQPNLVGGGGLTWRRVQKIIEMCELRPNSGMAEDCFFSQMCVYTEAKVLEFEDGRDIFCESYLSETPVGVHQWWTYAGQASKEIYEQYFNLYTCLDIKEAQEKTTDDSGSSS